MKVYICYNSWDYEGCSIPLAVFDSEDKAKAWCIINKKLPNKDADYEELEVK